MEKLNPCLICGHSDMYMCSHMDEIGLVTYRAFCNGCKTSFSNEFAEDTEHETTEWYNSLHKQGERTCKLKRTGRFWIDNGLPVFMCSSCGKSLRYDTVNYCQNCGARLVE